MKALIRICAVALACVLLVACGSSQERRDSFYEKAKQLAAAGNRQDAQIELKNALKIDPKFAKGYALLGQTQLEDKNWANAFASLNRAAELDPELMDAQLGLCKLFLMSRKLDKAEEKADFILSRQANNVDAGVIKSICLVKKGEVQQAMTLLAALQQANPDNPDVYMARAEALVAQKDQAGAEEVLIQGAAKKPGYLPIRLQLANMYTQQKRYDLAEQQFRGIVALDPASAATNMLLVNFLFQSGQKDKAVAALQALAQANPKEDSYPLMLAQAAEDAGKPQESEAILIKAQQDIPGSFQVRTALADHYVKTGHADKVEALLLEGIQKDPDSLQSVSARRVLARAYLATRQLDKAQAQLDALFKRNPRDTEGHLLMGGLNLQLGKPREAIVELRQALDADPKNLRALEQLAQAMELNNEGPLAESMLAKFIGENPDNVHARLLLVNTLMAANKPDRALAELNSLAAKMPANPMIFVAIGDLSMRKQNLAQARAAYKRAADVAPGSPVGFLKLGQLLALQKDLRGAHAAFDHVLSLTPDSREAIEGKAGLFLLEKRPAEALKLVGQRAQATPQDAWSQALLGRVMMDSGDLAGAEQQFAKAIQLAPDAPAPYQLLGALYIRQGKLDAGIGKYKEAYAASPAPGTGLALATLLQANNNKAEAIATYEKILAKDAGYIPAVNNLAYLYAEPPTTPEGLKRAQALAEKLKTVDSPESFDTVGWVQLQAGNKEEALKYLLRAWDKASGQPTVAFHVGMAYQAKGDTAAAAKWLEKSLAGNAQFPERATAQAELGRLRGRK